jgi:hypothetical protein
MHEFIGPGAGVLLHLTGTFPGLGQKVLSSTLNIVGVSLSVLRHLRGLGVRIGERLFGFLLERVDTCLSIPNDLLCPAVRVRDYGFRRAASARDVFLSRPLRHGQHMEGLVLGAGIDAAVPLHLHHGFVHRRTSE